MTFNANVCHFIANVCHFIAKEKLSIGVAKDNLWQYIGKVSPNFGNESHFFGNKNGKHWQMKVISLALK